MKCQMPREALVLLFFFFVFAWCVCGESSPSESERRALLELKRGVSDPDGVLSAWDGSDLLRRRHCSWPGVTCDSAARVVAVKIAGEGRGNGSEAPSCSLLSRGSGNVRVSGGSGRLRGEISPWVGKLRRLRVLSLPYNGLVGEIPGEIWGLVALEVLDLEGNSLTGTLPGRFGGLRRLRVLNLGFNRLRGEIPIGLSNCPALKVLNLAGNELSGPVPGFLGQFSKLSGLYLSGNRLVGDLPVEIGANCESLEDLDLAGNSLSGGIPGSLGKCRRLRRLLLFLNVLNGGIPRELGKLRLLEVLDVSGNRLSGPIPGELGQCDSMSVLVLSGGDSSLDNRFEGSIPEEITKLPSLKIVWAPSAGLQGKVPSNWGSCESLEMVNLARNGFDGEVFGVFEKCKKLHYLDLSSNKLNGKLDENLQVPCMTVFNVSKNLLSGPLPRFKDRSCSEVALGSDRIQVFTPSLPYKLYFACKIRAETNLPLGGSSLAVIHDLSDNSFSGLIRSLPVPLKRLGNNKMVYAFLVGGNKLIGTLPETIFRRCDGLNGMILNFSNNGLSGHIPRKIGAMCRSLMILDASGNQISGEVPKSLGDSTSLVVLDSSRNNLDVGVPLGGVPRSFGLFRILGSNDSPRRNRVLTSLAVQSVKDQDDLSLASQNDNEYQSGNGGLNSIEIASVASASAIVMVLLALIVLFFYTRKWVPDSRVQGLELREITVFSDVGAPLTFEGIVRSTGNFNASNCIGNGGFGSTFKSEIQPGVVVAVKRLSVGRFQQGIQQFHAEVKTLGRVRHPNLVTLLGYHASETEMFLIYNYLPGGNLEKFIKERSTRATDWKVLHKIALDIANALAYLHDQCVPRVLHRDVKPSNILLDNDLKAYLSDFGLSRLLGTSETHATTGVAGTFGYLAPEYAMTCRVSDKSDVYSYGVVLLELISDKRPLDPSFSSHGDGFNIVSWASMLLKQGKAKDVFTFGLWDTGPHDDLVEMLHLAVTCTNETLSIRPTMKHVVQRLKRIKPVSLGS